MLQNLPELSVGNGLGHEAYPGTRVSYPETYPYPGRFESVSNVFGGVWNVLTKSRVGKIPERAFENVSLKSTTQSPY